MTRKILVTVSAGVLLCGAIGFLLHRHWLKEASLTVANTAPYEIAFATYCRINQDHSVTEEWQTLSPGERKTIKREFWRIGPNFAVSAHSANPDLIRWIHNLPPTHQAVMYFEGGEEDAVTFQPVNYKNVDDAALNARNNESEMRLAGFVEVPVDLASLHATHQIGDDTFTGLYDRTGIFESDDEIEVFARRARLLGSVLERQMRFDRKWPNPDRQFPYRLGLQFNDHNGNHLPGVLIEVAAPMTIHDDPMPFRAGDILVSFGGQAVFSVMDLHMTLYEHATSFEKGIEVPIPFQVIRDGQRLDGKTLYFYNETYWGYNDADKRKAVLYGFGDGITCGFTVEAGVAVTNVGKFLYNLFRPKNTSPLEIETYKEEVWRGNQLKNRLRQMYSEQFDAGSFFGMVLPGPGRFLRPLARNAAGKFLSRRIASLAASASIEVIEGVVWTVASASPLRKSEEIADDITTVVPYAAGASIVFGSLTRGTSR